MKWEVETGQGNQSYVLDDGVCSRSQSLACSVGKKRQEVHPGVATLDGRVAGDEGQEDKVREVVDETELMMCDE